MKIRVLPLIIAFLLILQCGLVYGNDVNTHSAYRVTSYDLGSLQGFLDSGVLKPSQNQNPLFITKSTADTLNSEHQISVSLGEADAEKPSLNSFALSAQFDATSKISIHGALGLTRNLWTPDLFDSVNGSSWEANLGIIYKLLNNLSYELHFGYMDTGDLFNDQSSYSDVENIIMINNKLTLSF